MALQGLLGMQRPCVPKPTQVPVVIFIPLVPGQGRFSGDSMALTLGRQGLFWGEGSGPVPRSQAVGLDWPAVAGGPGRAQYLACADLPSGAGPALMKWASLRPTLISRPSW